MYNSDGYVMIDMKDVNMSQSSQHISGIYNRVVSVIDTNKLALIINAGSNTPMAAVVHKRLNYYVINTTLYIFTINSNDIVIIEEAGTATVDVEIVPTLTEGVKVADFAVGTVEGSIYAPAQESEINDNVTATNTTWSSDKISDELSDKADSSDVYTKAQVDTALSSKADSSDVYTKAQVDNSLSSKADSADVYTKAQVDTALSSKADSSTVSGIAAECDNNFDYTINETVIGNYFGRTLYRRYFDIGILPNNSTLTVDIMDNTIRDLIDIRIIAQTTTSDSFITLPYQSSQAAFNIDFDVECSGGKTKVNITTHRDRTNLVAFGIIEYTKWN